MSLHYIIDGYNLIRQTRVLNKTKIKDSRQALLRFIQVYRSHGRSSNRITVVFDGKSRDHDSLGPAEFIPESRGIEIFFANTQSADEKIVKLVENSRNPKNIFVVTNDKELRFLVKQRRAGVKTVEEFLAKVFQPSKPQESPDEPILNPSEAAKITEELRELWLK